MTITYNDNLIPYLYESVYVVDKQRKIIFWNEGSERITGYTALEVTNSFCYHNILQHIDENGKHLCHGGCPLQKTLVDGIINEARVYLKHKEGYRIPVMVKTLPIYDNENNIVAAIEVFTDERFQKQIYHENQELKNKLRIDPLTQIANRHFFDFQLSKKIEETKVFSNSFGILMIDIDHFKHVNDTHGHLVGDEILKKVAHSLASSVEKTDLVSRWGGEEFVVIVDVDNQRELLKIAERLRHVVMSSSHQMENGKTISVTISIGGTMSTKDDDINLLIARADENMYFVKQNGRNQSKVT